MPSTSYRRWRTVRRAALDLVESAHATIHGTGPGRREATRQLNHGYVVLLAAEFQGFCRELHTEAVALFASTIPALQRTAVIDNFALNRQLDRGNANPGSLGSDFGRLGLDWWDAIDNLDPNGPVLRRELELMNQWRNAIAHNDFDPKRLGGTMRLKFSMVRNWRRVCNRLTRAFDHVLANHLVTMTGQQPW
jgi:hypothetical protein